MRVKSPEAATLMYALVHAWLVHIQCGDCTEATAEAEELVALADVKGTSFWKALGMSVQGCTLALIGRAPDAIQMIHLRHLCIAVNGINIMDAVVFIFGKSLFRTWPIRRRVAMH